MQGVGALTPRLVRPLLAQEIADDVFGAVVGEAEDLRGVPDGLLPGETEAAEVAERAEKGLVSALDLVVPDALAAENGGDALGEPLHIGFGRGGYGWRTRLGVGFRLGH